MSKIARIRVWLILFVIGLVLSGLTAFPLLAETTLLVKLIHADSSPLPQHLPVLVDWLDRVHNGLVQTDRDFPFIAYGTDWLAFAHLVIAVAFWGPLKDPVRNVWVIQWGMFACIAIIPLALIAGPIRGIPWWWTIIDMSFGVFGIIPLLFAHANIRALARQPEPDPESVT